MGRCYGVRSLGNVRGKDGEENTFPLGKKVFTISNCFIMQGYMGLTAKRGLYACEDYGITLKQYSCGRQIIILR